MFIIERPYAKKFNAYLRELQADKKTYLTTLSALDKQSSDLLHYLENNENLSRSELADIGEKLGELRRARRKVKNAINDIQSVLKNLKSEKELQEIVTCEYRPRTDILKDF